MYPQPYNHPFIQSHPQQFHSAPVPVYSRPPEMSHPQPKLFQDGSAPVFRACSSAMQRPTLTNVRIRSTRDADQIFYAVLRNLLPMTVRRLDAEERRAITSGNVYVWEERGASSEATGLGIERWTDGMRWSPSRVRDEFLFYHQKEMDPDEAAGLPPTRWARIVRPKTTGADGSSSDTSPDTIPHQRALNDPEKLIKQTYSVLVAFPQDMQRGLLRKWHLTAYFTQSTVDKLQVVDDVLPKPHTMVPEGLFRSARAGKMRRDTAAGRLQQQQQDPRQIYYDPDALGPSGSTPVSYVPPANTPSSSTYGPYAASYPHLTSPAYPYSHPHPQYSAYVQDDTSVHRAALPPAALPPPPSIPPPGGQYTIAPAPHRPPPPPPPPPPPQRQSSINEQGRGSAIGYARPPREWVGEHGRQAETQRDFEREHASPRGPPLALPNTYDPGLRRVPSTPSQGHSPSYLHPHSNAVQGHVVRTTAASAGAPTATTSQVGSGSEYYSPAKPIKPIDVTPSRHRARSVASPVSAGTLKMHEGPDCTRELDSKSETEFDAQRDSAIGPNRGPTTPSPSHKRLLLRSRLSSSPRSFPSSARSEPGARLRSVSVSGPTAPDQETTTSSPMTGKLSLEEERTRSLVPLTSLENAVFPRRDPTDDALLRRFNALRTTPPTSTTREE